jgi:AraC-like DNA-binding protein
MVTIVWIGFCQSLFAAIYMFAKKDNSLPDKILSGWLMLLSIEFMTCGIDYELFGKPLLSSSFLLFNPAMFLYICSLTSKNLKLSPYHLLHLLPFIFFETYAYITLQPFEMDTFFIHDKNYLFRMFFAAATIVSWLVYNSISMYYVHRYRKYLKSEWSTIEKGENLGWVLAVLIFYVVYCSFAFGIASITYFADFNPLTPHIYNYVMLLFLVFVISFYGMRQNVVIKQLPEPAESIPYKNSLLSTETKNQIRQKLIDYVERNKAYLNPDLNMELIAINLGFPKYQITEVLNTEIGKSFFQFINSYRVDAVKKMLSDPNNKYSIEAIGYDCGFASKSSFYTVFKKFTNETPLAYRNRMFQ